jgi:hypothetical protein
MSDEKPEIALEFGESLTKTISEPKKGFNLAFCQPRYPEEPEIHLCPATAVTAATVSSKRESFAFCFRSLQLAAQVDQIVKILSLDSLANEAKQPRSNGETMTS